VPVEAKPSVDTIRSKGQIEPSPTTTDLDALLDGRPQYRGYDGRLGDWFARKDRATKANEARHR
jgi:hypothetical protein